MTTVALPSPKRPMNVIESKVSVIFCDVCDFTSLTRAHNPQTLVLTLDLLFRKFDRLCDKHGILKIETVGESFM